MIINIFGPSGSGKTTFIKDLLKSNKTKEFFVEITKDNFNEEFPKKISISLMPLPLFRGDVKEFFNIFSIEVDILLNLNYELRNLSDSIFERIDNQKKLAKVSCRNVETFSAGEMRRLFLLKSLIVDSDIVILDEPFSNSDKKLWSVIYSAIITKSRAIVLSHQPLKKFIVENEDNLHVNINDIARKNVN